MKINMTDIIAKVWTENDRDHKYNSQDVKRLMDKYYAARSTLRLTNEANGETTTSADNRVKLINVVAQIWKETTNIEFTPYMVRKMVDSYYTTKMVVNLIVDSIKEEEAE